MCWSVLPEFVNILVRYQVSDEDETILFVGDSLFWSQDIRVKCVSAEARTYFTATLKTNYLDITDLIIH